MANMQRREFLSAFGKSAVATLIFPRIPPSIMARLAGLVDDGKKFLEKMPVEKRKVLLKFHALFVDEKTAWGKDGEALPCPKEELEAAYKIFKTINRGEWSWGDFEEAVSGNIMEAKAYFDSVSKALECKVRLGKGKTEELLYVDIKKESGKKYVIESPDNYLMILTLEQLGQLQKILRESRGMRSALSR